MLSRESEEVLRGAGTWQSRSPGGLLRANDVGESRVRSAIPKSKDPVMRIGVWATLYLLDLGLE